LRPIVLLTALSRGPEQLLCPIEVDLRQPQLGLGLIEVGDASVQKGDLVVEVLHGALQFPAPASGFGFNPARLGFGRLQVRLGLRYPGPVVVILDFDQHLAFFDALKIIHGHPAHITFDLGAERRDVAANISIVCDLPDRQTNPAVPLSSDEDDDNPGGEQNGEPDHSNPRPRPSSRPRHIRRRSLLRRGQHRRSFVIGG
jgi:hypothetical protein